MSGRNKTSSQRLLLITNEGASLFSRERGSLIKSDHFAAHDVDRRRFEQTLNGISDCIFSIIVDYIEEDFRHETVAHVQGRDRQEMLRRKQALMFRNSHYRTSRVLGRENTGRRDDKILFTALSRTDVINHWLQPILERQIAIRAITSASFVMEYLARQQGLHKKNHLLLVNVEPLSGIRQTYLQKGKVLFSRLLPSRADQDNISTNQIEDQTLQTRKYLERIRLIGFDEPLEAVVYLDAAVMDELTESSREQMQFHWRAWSSLPGSSVLQLPDGAPGSCLLAALAELVRHSKITNIYGQPVDLRYYQIGLAQKALFAASMVLMAVALLVSAPVLMTYLQNGAEAEQMAERTAPLLRQYEELRQRFPETPIPSNTMALLVETYDKLAAQARAPENDLFAVSRALAAAPAVRLTNLIWRQEEQPVDTYEGMPEVQRFMQLTLDQSLQIRMEIQGQVVNARSIRAAHEQVMAFIAALEQQTGGIVVPIDLPTDVSSSNLLEMNLDDRPVEAVFTLSVIMTPGDEE